MACPSPVPREPAQRPRLKTGLTPLWRDDSTIQIGLDEHHATVIGNLSSTAASVLRLLDGHRTRDEIEQAGGAIAPLVLALLDEQGLLCDEDPFPAALRELDPDTRRRCEPEIAALRLRSPHPGEALQVFGARRSRRVLVRGAGRVGTGIAHLLSASGIGRVTIEDDGKVDAADVCPGAASQADIGLRRGAAAAALSARAFPPALGAGKPDVALICASTPIPPAAETWKSLVDDGTAVLPIVLRESTAVVGPFITPTHLSVSGCPGCLDQHRAGRDRHWPVLSAQLRSDGEPGPPAAALVWATAALAVSQCLELLDRRARAISPVDGDDPVASVGATLELTAGCWAWRRRWWGRHPACACAAAVAA